MNNISGYGVIVTLRASVTFPQGITITQFADDADPVDSPAIQIKDKAMGLNGDLVVWDKANPLPVTLNVIPSSNDDINLQVLSAANRVGKGKNSAGDVITMTVQYQDGKVVTLTQGALTDAIFGNPIASTGRKKSKPYSFTFENMTETFNA